MKVILVTYRDIGWIVKAYVHLHQKYWGAPVVLLAEDDYSDGVFEFIRVPNEAGLEWENNTIPPWHFSDVLFWYFRQIEDKHVIIMLADYLITHPVDTTRLKQLEEYMNLHDNILRGQVGDDTGLCIGTKTEVYKDISIWDGGFLPTSLTPGMWNRDFLMELMTVHDTPWGIESKGREKFIAKGWRSIAPAPGCVRYLNAIRGRQMDSIVITEEVYREVGHFLHIKPRGFVVR